MAHIRMEIDDYQVDELVIESLKEKIQNLLSESPLHEFDAAVNREIADNFITVLDYYLGDKKTMEFLNSIPGYK